MLAASARSLDIVGGTIAAGSVAMVVSVDHAHTLHLDAVDPQKDTVVWQRPYSASAITPGVALLPAAAGATVADIVPAKNLANPAVMLDGINASTGTVEWQLPGPFVLSDNPASCVGDQDFCVTAYNSDGSSSLAMIDASTGRTTSVINGPNRALGTGLYQSSDQTPTVEQLSATGSIAWTKPVAAIFGAGYDPSAGWNVTPVGSLDVGSVGSQLSGSSVDLSRNKTVGFAVSSGATQWSLAGSYQCMGPLVFLSTQVTCQYSGTVHYSRTSSKPPSLQGVTLKLVGFNSATGSPTWSYPVSDIASLTFGNGLRFVDADHVVVQSANGKMVNLDTTTGTSAPLEKNQVLWCEKNPTYTIKATKGAPGGGKRGGETVYYPCTSSGAPSSKRPASTPSTIGVTVNGIFVWPSPSGLRTQIIATAVTHA